MEPHWLDRRVREFVRPPRCWQYPEAPLLAAAAAALGVELSPLGMRDAGEVERSISRFARSANGGLILVATTLALVHRDSIISLAAHYRLPAVYFGRDFVAAGGLIAYGPNQIDPCRRAAGYVDRILRGGKPADLPVQAPTKYELVEADMSQKRPILVLIQIGFRCDGRLLLLCPLGQGADFTTPCTIICDCYDTTNTGTLPSAWLTSACGLPSRRREMAALILRLGWSRLSVTGTRQLARRFRAQAT